MDPDRLPSLRDPSVYPCSQPSPGQVEIIQTHLSVVCLLGDDAWKLKKSIRLPFADFSSLERRHHFCQEELRLNRRLCPDLYLGVVPLRRRPDGRLSLHPGSDGEIIDHAVHMRRLPADRMLDVLLDRDEVGPEAIEAIAGAVTAFHAGADRGPETLANGDPDRLHGFATANFDDTRPQAGDHAGALFSARLHGALEARMERDFQRHLPTLHERCSSGMVVDGHGDLHSRNICLDDPLAIYDCIEFDPALRCGDVATEHAFLAMDLRFRGHPELARRYLDAVLAATGDRGMLALMPTLVRYRAMVRAKVAAVAAAEAELGREARARAADSARRHLRLAAATAVAEPSPLWLMFCGLPGAGKSSLAAALAGASCGAWPVFSSDRIRKRLAGRPARAKLPSECYRPDFSRRTYAEMLRLAAEATTSAGVVILDANFRSRDERALARSAALAAGARLVIVRVNAPAAAIAARLDRRQTDPQAESDADPSVYQQLAAAFEEPSADEADRLLSVPGDAPPEVVADDVLAALVDG